MTQPVERVAVRAVGRMTHRAATGRGDRVRGCTRWSPWWTWR